MGLMNASTQFQQMMDDRTQPVRDIADAYIDDVIAGTRVEPDEDALQLHHHDLCRVLDLLAEEKLIADISKCKFLCARWNFAATS